MKQRQPDIPGKTYDALDGKERHLEIFTFVAGADGRVTTGEVQDHIEISRQRTRGHLRDMREAEVLQSISEGRENEWEVRDEHDPETVLERPKVEPDGGYASAVEFVVDYDELVTVLIGLTLFGMLATAMDYVLVPLGRFPEITIAAMTVAWATFGAITYAEVYR